MFVKRKWRHLDKCVLANVFINRIEIRVGSIKMVLCYYPPLEYRHSERCHVLTSNDFFRVDLRVFLTGTTVTGVEGAFLLERVRRPPSMDND